MRKVMTVVALVGALCVAATKVYNGEAPSWPEIMLAASAVAAAFGFQTSK